ncbi:MAG: hypothetical protein JRJ85_22720 [Deltaproteobacteria bacterium]|nr:hypothetical protein [Deltaproteobacteria bacterium]
MDPEYLQAYVFLGMIHIREARNGWSESPQNSVEHANTQRNTGHHNKDPRANLVIQTTGKDPKGKTQNCSGSYCDKLFFVKQVSDVRPPVRDPRDAPFFSRVI